MGTFMGHFLPGAFFITFAIWWTIQIWCKYLHSRRTNKVFRSEITYRCRCLPGRLKHWNVEGILKIFFCIVGLTGELATGMSNGHILYFGNLQHATMFTFFGMVGVIDILESNGFNIIPNIQYVSSIIAFSVEGILFQYHVTSDKLEIILHKLLSFAICGCVVSILIEMVYRNAVLATMSRAYFTFLQGTWFVHVAFVLFPPIPAMSIALDHKSNNTVMLTSAYFTWHAGSIFLFMLIVGYVTKCCLKARDTSEYDEVAMQSLLTSKRNGKHQTVLPMDASDLESDTEFGDQRR